MGNFRYIAFIYFATNVLQTYDCNDFVILMRDRPRDNQTALRDYMP